MAEETEAKFYVSSLDELQRRVEELGATRGDARVHELNLRFDNEAGDMQRRGRVLRLRQDTRARLTYKDTDTMQPGSLTRREVEITVSDFDTARELLEALGYKAIFIYEKYRTTYELHGQEIVLDELPYGHFVEIEGDGERLQATAEALGLKWGTVIRDSYSKLFERLRGTRGLEFRDLTFGNMHGIAVTAADLGVSPADA
jgi:adenylate cyclase class 2